MLSAILGEEVDVVIGGRTAVLRPTLRAGIAAHRLHGSFPTLLKMIEDLDSRTICRLIEIGAGANESRGLEFLGPQGLLQCVEALTQYVVILANGGTMPVVEDQNEGESSGEASHEVYFARLFKIGTGWIGWTPDQTLDMPMPAIVSAYAGRQDMLRAIFGDGKPSGRNKIPLDEKVRAIFGHMGTTKVEPVAVVGPE